MKFRTNIHIRLLFLLVFSSSVTDLSLKNGLKRNPQNSLAPSDQSSNSTQNNSTLNGSKLQPNQNSSYPQNSTQSFLNHTFPHLSSFEKRVQSDTNLTHTSNLSQSPQVGNKSSFNHTHEASNNSTETNINSIIHKTEKIKSEICDSSKLINSSLNQLDDQINEIKNDLKNLTDQEKNENELIVKFTVCINNVNLIKADLIKISDILETLKKANCKHFEETQKKFDAESSLVNKLVTNIQNFLRTKNLNINLVILT
jgi:hypothetical protein